MENVVLPTDGIKVVILCGGSGSGPLANQLLEHGANVTCLVNAYDDGRSTGRLRHVFEVLGPSDLRKNLLSLMDLDVAGYWSRREVFAYRFPADESRADNFRSEIADICARRGELARGERRELPKMIARLPAVAREPLVGYLQSFMRELEARECQLRTSFSISDCALGNCFLIGAYLETGRCWNSTLSAVDAILGIRGRVELASVENRYLFGVCNDGRLLTSEHAVITEADGDIVELFLSETPVKAAGLEKWLAELGVEAAVERIRREVHSPPAPNPVALRALAEADVVVYGPGTFHSSLLPTLMIDGVPAAITQCGATRIMVTNIIEEADTRGYSCADLAHEVVRYVGNSAYSYLIVNEPAKNRGSEYIALDARLSDLEATLVTCDFEDRARPGRHRAPVLAQAIFNVARPGALTPVVRPPEPLVSVVMLAWNRKDEVEIGLSEMRSCSYKNIEMILIDNGSQDRTAEMVRDKFPEVTVVRVHKNVGMTGYNIGLVTARGKYVVMLDDDSHLAPDAIETMVRLWEADVEGRIGAMAFRVVNPRLGSLITHLWEERLCDVEPGREREITSFAACGAAVRRSLLDEVGFFDDDFFVQATEDDLGIRIWNAGYKIVYEPRCLAYHRESRKNRSWRRYGFAFRNAAWFNLKHLPWRFIPLAVSRNLFWLLLRSIRFRSFGYFIYGLRSYIQGYLQAWVPLAKRRVVAADVARFCLNDDWISRPIIRTLWKIVANRRYILDKRGVEP